MTGPGLVLRERRPQGTCVELAPGLALGARPFVVMAGPCAVEDERQIHEAAAAVAQAGCPVLRGGAFKPRTSPYTFQGLGAAGVRLLADAANRHGLAAVTEILDPADLPLFEGVALLQVGARNMQNFALLRKLALINKPVLLKRGPSATVKEWLLAAEYLLAGGNSQVVLCERGIKTFETEMRNTLDLAAVALARELSHLPVLADPSHGTGRRSLIAPLCRAAFALGADGVIIEVHPCPERALSDGAQSLDFKGFAEIMQALYAPLPAIARAMSASAQ